jgi:hypothetical protein
MHIKVQDIGGQCQAFKVEPSDTIRSLKARIAERKGCSIDEIGLVLPKDTMGDDDTLEYCMGYTLIVTKELLGGGPPLPIGPTFNALNKEVIIPLGPTADDEKHRIVTPGLSFKSKCKNPSCSVYKKEIYVNKGYNKGPYERFNVAILCVTLKCPICEAKAEPATSCGFILSQWTFTGVTKEGDEFNKSGETTSKNYHTWDEGDDTGYAALEVRVDPYNPN